jgi:hypothetical protein
MTLQEKLEAQLSKLFERTATAHLETAKTMAAYRDTFEDEEAFVARCNLRFGVRRDKAEKYLAIAQHYDRLKKCTLNLPVSFEALHVLAIAPVHHFDALLKESVIKPGVSATTVKSYLDKLAEATVSKAGKNEEKASDQPKRQKTKPAPSVELKEMASTLMVKLEEFEPVNETDRAIVEGVAYDLTEALMAFQKRMRAGRKTAA